MGEKLQLGDYLVHDLLRDLADSLDVSYEEENNEMCLDLPETLGTGYVKAVSFSHGLGFIDLDVRLKQELRLQLTESKVKPLKMVFNREDEVQHRFEGEEHDSHEIKHLESATISSNNHHSQIFILPPETPICFFSLEINRKLFEEKIEPFLPDMNSEIEKLFRDVNGVNLFFSKSHYSLDIAKCIEEILNCELTGLPRSAFLEGKCYEILAYHFKQYQDDLKSPEGRKILRQNTVEKIEEASNIIQEELEHMGSILSLAHRVGLNQNTLQSGFKHLYGASVNQYIRDARLEKAKALIENTDLNITEITYKIGINSRSYFSKLFKERYGMSPKTYLQKVRYSNRAV